MASESPLLNLPEDAMENVLHYCNYLEIASLRKTCRSLREFVDTTKPDGRMDKVEIECDEYEGNFRLQSGKETTHIVYRKVMNGCYVFNNTNSNRTKQVLLYGMDYLEMLKKDLTLFLRHQKSVLKEIRIEGKPFALEQALNALKAHSKNPKTRKFPLKTTILSLRELPAPQILLALSSVDAKSLCSLSIGSQKQGVLTDDITATEQWRHLDTFCATGFRILDVRRISHLNTFSGLVSSVTAADLEYLKTTFLNSPDFQVCSMKCDRVASYFDIVTTFGVHSPRREWLFRKPNDAFRVLSLSVDSSNVRLGHRNTNTCEVTRPAEIIG